MCGSAVGDQFVAQLRHGTLVHVDQHHGHAQPVGVSGEAGAYAGTGAGDDRDTATEGPACVG
ncbi:hypothetical protein GCM10010409_48770 [Mycolicibacterium diernhoferi]